MAVTQIRTSLVTLANMWLPGVYAWVTTVGYPAGSRDAGLAGRLCALSALAALLTGPIVALNRPKLGRAVGVFGFVGLSVLTWVLLSPLISLQQLEPIRAGFGALGWLLFAFGWGSLRLIGSIPEDNPRAVPGAPLVARGQLPRGTLVIFGGGCVAAMSLLLLAWRVTRPMHALLAHAVAIACALWLVSAAAQIALERGSWVPATPARVRFGVAARPLSGLLLLVVIGVIWLLFG